MNLLVVRKIITSPCGEDHCRLRYARRFYSPLKLRPLEGSGQGGHGGCVCCVFCLCVLLCCVVFCLWRDRWFLVNPLVQLGFQKFPYQRGETLKNKPLWEQYIVSNIFILFLVDTITPFLCLRLFTGQKLLYYNTLICRNKKVIFVIKQKHLLRQIQKFRQIIKILSQIKFVCLLIQFVFGFTS